MAILKVYKFILFLLFSGSLPLLTVADDKPFSVDLEPRTVSIGEQLTLSISVTGDLDDDLHHPQIEGLEFLGQGSSQSIQIINGAYSKTYTLNFTYRAEKAGTFQIKPFNLKVKGQDYSTDPIAFKVTAEGEQEFGASQGTSSGSADGQKSAAEQKSTDGQKDSDASKAAPYAFVKQIIDEPAPYLNQPVLQTIKIYYRVDLAKAESLQQGDLAYFRVFELGQVNSQETVDGENYRVIVLKRILSPRKIGAIKIPPFKINLGLVLPQESTRRSGRRGRDMFFDFFGDNRGKLVEKVLSSNEVDIEIKDLPSEKKPANFSGLVGFFNLSGELAPRKLEVSDTSTLTLNISGYGSLDPLGKIQLDPTDGLKIYEDKPLVEEKADEQHGIVSHRIYKFALVPTKPGTTPLKPFVLHYFDPSAKIYKELTYDPGALEVTGSVAQPVTGGNTPLSPTMSKQAVESKAQDLIDIHRSTVLRDSEYSWKWIILYVLTIFNLLSVFILWCFQKLRGNSSKFSAKQRRKDALKHYQNSLKKITAIEDPKEKILGHFEAYKEFLGNKLNLYDKALTTKELFEKLKTIGFKDEDCQQAESIAKAMDQLTFAEDNFLLQNKDKLHESIEEMVQKVEKQC